MKGNYAYVSGFPGTKVAVVDVTNKASPSVVKTLTDSAYSGIGGNANVGNTLYAVSFSANYFLAFDITDPPNTAELTKTAIPVLDGPNRIDINGTTAYVASAGDAARGSIVTLNITTPASPVVTYIDAPAQFAQCYAVRHVAGRLYAISRVDDRFISLAA